MLGPLIVAVGLLQTCGIAHGSESKISEVESMILEFENPRLPAKLGAQGRRKPTHPLMAILQMVRQGKHEEASIQLFNLSRSARYQSERPQLKYILSLSLAEMGLNQVAAFQLVDLVRLKDKRYFSKALGKLVTIAHHLDNDQLTGFAVGQLKKRDFPHSLRDIFYFSEGQNLLAEKKFDKAALSFKQVSSNSEDYLRAIYNQGLAYALANKPGQAFQYYQRLFELTQDKPPTHSERVLSQLGMARTLYQAKRWQDSIQAYWRVPRDSPFWHSILFEQSWAQLQNVEFRKALGNFQSLHSPFYESYYLPESLLLRAIVYLYICQYDEMEKVLALFDHLYGPLQSFIPHYLNQMEFPDKVFNEVRTSIEKLPLVFMEEVKPSELKIPPLLARKLQQDGELGRVYNYNRKLISERDQMKSLTLRWKLSPLGRYSERLYLTRIEKSQSQSLKVVRSLLRAVRTELTDFSEQVGLLKYELVNGRKEQIKSKLASSKSKVSVEGDTGRSVYVQNGYNFWPFRGEYWLDEIGNQYYVGAASCR